MHCGRLPGRLERVRALHRERAVFLGAVSRSGTVPHTFTVRHIMRASGYRKGTARCARAMPVLTRTYTCVLQALTRVLQLMKSFCDDDKNLVREYDNQSSRAGAYSCGEYNRCVLPSL